MPATNRPTGRLLPALALSIALHAAVILPWPHFASVDITPGRQIHLSATLSPNTRAPESPPKPIPPRKPEKDRRGVERAPQALTSSSPNPVLVTQGNEAAEPAQEAPEQGETLEAYVLDMPTPPEYPAEALQRNLEGCVLASVLVAESGEVKTVEIVAAEPAGVFDLAVIDSQKTARYGAAKLNGEAVESRVLAVASFVIGSGRRLNCALKFAPLAQQLSARGAQKQ